MKITNCGRGVHKREVRGIERLRNTLPSHWYGYTNLDVVIGLGRPREIDVVIISDHRIFLLDLKDWFGRIESFGDRWLQNGKERDRSPVQKLNETARDLFPLLKASLSKRVETKQLPVPKIDGVVVLTNRADISGVADVEQQKILTMEDFVRIVSDNRRQRDAFGNVPGEFVSRPLTDQFWKEKINQFFRGTTFKPGIKRYERYLADDTPSFQPLHGIYQEFDAHEEGAPSNLGTLRTWDFSSCPDARFQTEEGRLEIAGRERAVYAWLRDRSEEIERMLLPTKIDDPEKGINYWEIYDRRRRMLRLGEFAATEGKRLLPSEKLELARQLLSLLALLHRQDATHLDLDAHSIWLEAPTSVRFSHLLAVRLPEGRSLGKSRFQFLASTSLPEEFYSVDEGPKRRDVFLAGVAVHLLLFGTKPNGSPPEWDPAIDAKNEYLTLHDWFAEALEHNPGSRFADAINAHEALVRSTASRPTYDEVLAGLEQFRGSVRSQRQIALSYPNIGEMIRESDRLDAWRSEKDGRPVVVKLWKQAAWGDTRKEGSTILSFLKRANDQKADRPAGLPVVRDVIWLGDSFVLVQDWVEGQPLSRLIASGNRDAASGDALDLLRSLIVAVHMLHESGYGHGDLKPENIVVCDEDERLVLIDVLDFSTQSDGEIMSPAYSPDGGSRFERDRFAVTKIAEELLGTAAFTAEEAATLELGIRDVREKSPPLTTLDPLLDAIDGLQKHGLGTSAASPIDIEIAIVGAETGTIAPDEGYIHLRTNRDKYNSRTLHLRGACEEIVCYLSETGHVMRARRRALEQRRIAQFARFEFCRLPIVLTVRGSDIADLSQLDTLLANEQVKKAVDALIAGIAAEPHSEPEETSPVAEDDAEDQLAEQIEAESPRPADIDVRLLWRTLIGTENELSTEAVAQLASLYNSKRGHHRVPIELESGLLDFAREDRVSVEVLRGRDDWRPVGDLDVRLSGPDTAVFESRGKGSDKDGLIEAGQRLRFISHFEVQSLRRRTDAVERVLGGSGRLTDLLSVFDPRSEASPHLSAHEANREAIAAYNLNDDQREAFEKILSVRPVGLVQGPPGTGKTRFIAALAHYALTRRLVQNVLLTSQSHEAVNTAADAVLKHFRESGVEPSMLRVAMSEDLLSEELRPYHAQRVEQALKDRFKASFRQRIGIVGAALGVPDNVVDDVVDFETVVRPVCRRLEELVSSEEADASRVNGLKETLERQLDRLELPYQIFSNVDAETLSSSILGALNKKFQAHGYASADRIEKLRTAVVLGNDFVGSVSRGPRSFETFFAATRQIVVGTCVGLGRTSLGLTSTPFDLVIVDEAARCTASELLVPLQSARWAVLVGDQAQLEPHHKPEVVNLTAERTRIPKREIVRSDFERVFLSQYGSAAATRLRTQYRMLPAIGRLVSEAFYPDLKLLSGRSEPVIDPALMPESLGAPLVWIETDSLGEIAFEEKEKDGSSRSNRIEADAIVSLLDQWHAHEPFKAWLLAEKKQRAGIGVICMYAAQRDLIRRKLMQSPLSYLLDGYVKLGTVDSYQGKENPIIVLSLVRNNDQGPNEFGVRRIKEGFLSAPNRINVSASRAMDRLVIVGARNRWRQNSAVGRLAAGFSDLLAEEGQAVVIDASSVVAPADEARASRRGSSKAKSSKAGNVNG